MAVDAEAKHSFFTRQLAGKLEHEGIATPPYILDLLDKPFASFSAEDRKLYETQVKGKELPVLFARLLQNIYEASGGSSRHSWKSMCHLLKDSPIKVCVSFVLNQEEQRKTSGEREAGSTRAREAVSAPRGDGEEDEAGPARGDAASKSFFTKKLERKLDEREIEVPAPIIALLDKPFEDFSVEEQRLYEAEFRGRQLTILFSELLDELYEETGRVASGWNAMCRYLRDTPMKLIATYVVKEEERLEEAEDAGPEEPPGGQYVKERYNVKRFQPAQDGQKGSQSRRRRK
jgi:hypothetical protein